MSDAFELEICQGKYRYRYEAGKQEVWRNGYIWQTLNGKLIGDKFVFSLAVELDEALKECGELRAKIEAMEQQEPVATIHINSITGNPSVYFIPGHRYLHHNSSLYALPGAQPAPSVPDGWLRAIDEALVVANIGVANAHDTYEQAKAKLDNLIGFHVDVATDPAVNGGWKLVPIEPTSEMLGAGEDTFVTTYTGTPVSAPIDVYRAMLAAAPEAKP